MCLKATSFLSFCLFWSLTFHTIQMVMAVFAYIYHQSFIVPQSLSVEMIMDQVHIIYVHLSIYMEVCVDLWSYLITFFWIYKTRICVWCGVDTGKPSIWGAASSVRETWTAYHGEAIRRILNKMGSVIEVAPCFHMSMYSSLILFCFSFPWWWLF